MIRSLFIATTLLFAASQIAFAQPPTETAPKVANPPNRTFPTREDMDKIFRGTEELMKATPEQRKARMRALNQGILRVTLREAGFTDKTLQDQILLFIDEQEKSRQKVRDAATKVYLALTKQATPTGEQEMNLLLGSYLNAVEAAKPQRETATKAFDKQINFTSKPRLMAFLTLNGIIGDAAWFTGDVTMMGNVSQGSLDGILDAPPVAP